MVKVLLCHHFKSQIVSCPKAEPKNISLFNKLLFVCTSAPQIQVYTVKEALSEPGAVFDTTGEVISLIYFKANNSIVTLEKLSQSRGTVICLYHLIYPSCQPVHCKLPFSGVINPSCISGDVDANNVCVGSKERVLLYHLTSSKDTSKPSAHCYNVECLVEVNVSFTVCHVCLCEEYILCASSSEVQLVRLKVTTSAGREDANSTPLLKEHKVEEKDISHLVQGTSYVSPYIDNVPDWESYHQSKVALNERSSSRASNSSQRSQQRHLVTEDQHHVTLRDQFEDLENVKDCIGTKWLKSISEAYESQAQSLHKDQIIIGPIQNHPRCAVFISHIAPSVSGSVDRSMLTYLYRAFDSSEITHIQLVLVYVKGSKYHKGTHPIHSKHCTDTVMLCYVSTATEGYLYSVISDRTRLLQKYTYTTQMIQVCLTAHQLFVATVSGLEIYTVEGTAQAVVGKQQGPATHKLFSECKEPCMIGLQPFMSVNTVSLWGNHVTVLSKGQTQGESVWSIYVLQKPEPVDLMNDMMELALLHKSSSEGTYLYMLQQIYAYSWVYTYLSNQTETDSKSRGIYQEVAFLLGQAKEKSEWKLSLPFFLQSEKGLAYILSSACISNPLGKGFWNYIDYMLFERKESLSLDKDHAHLLLDAFTRWRPLLLSRVIVTSSLTGYDPAFACECLEKCKAVGGRHTSMNTLTTVTLKLQQSKVMEAQQALGQIPKDWLQKLCIKHSHMIHESNVKLSALGRLLREEDSDMFVDILSQCVQDNSLSLDSVKVLSPETYIQVAEKLACDNNSVHLFCDISADLAQVYLKGLTETWADGHMKNEQTTQKYIIPRRDGLFKNRYKWLDHIYPLEGTDALTKECHHQSQSHCPCTSCNADLLKLQCLLCSPQLPDKITESTKSTTAPLPQLQSIYMLCLKRTDMPTFIDVLITKYPKLVPMVLKQSQDVDLAQNLAKYVFSLQRNLEQSKALQSNTHKQLLKEILSVLCEMMSPADLFTILPPDGNTRFFLPYVMRCLELQQSRVVMDDLQRTINKVLSS